MLDSPLTMLTPACQVGTGMLDVTQLKLLYIGQEVMFMPHPRYSSAEIVQRGQTLYDERIRAKVEASHQGKFLAVDIETGEYEIDADELAALKRAKAKHPDAALYLVRIGSSTAYRLGGQRLVTPS